MQGPQVVLLFGGVIAYSIQMGKKIPKKLCNSISKETKAAKKLFQEYSTAAYGLKSVEPLPSFGDILQPQADFWVQHKRKQLMEGYRGRQGKTSFRLFYMYKDVKRK